MVPPSASSPAARRFGAGLRGGQVSETVPQDRSSVSHNEHRRRLDGDSSIRFGHGAFFQHPSLVPLTPALPDFRGPLVPGVSKIGPRYKRCGGCFPSA